MNVTRTVTLTAAAALTVVAMTGCSGGGTEPAQDAGRKIQEYRGDGHGGTKPLLGSPVGDALAAVAGPLNFGKAPVDRTVPEWQVNWFRLPAVNTKSPVVCTLQPTANEDADLYLLNGDPGRWPGGGGLVGWSNRSPVGQRDGIGSLAPDWVAFDPGYTGSHPAALVGVYGYAGTGNVKPFTLEADRPIRGIIDGTSNTLQLAERDSQWFWFQPTLGRSYSVILENVTQGDPDLYVYGSRSTLYVASDLATGGGTVTFTAETEGPHYVRVYATAGAGLADGSVRFISETLP